MAQVTLKGFINHFQQNLNDPASILTLIKEKIYIIRKEPKTEINVSMRMIWKSETKALN